MKSIYLIMKMFGFLLSIIVLFGCSNQNIKEKENEKEQIIKIEKERLKALVDVNINYAKQVHADDFQLVTPGGYIYDKTLYLGQIESGELDYKKWDPGEITVRLYGKVAVIRYRDTACIVYVDGKLDLNGRPWHTNLYEKRNGQWQVVWSQASVSRTQTINLSE